MVCLLCDPGDSQFSWGNENRKIRAKNAPSLFSAHVVNNFR